MASTTMHMAITSLLISRISVQIPDRLMFGAVLPDAYADGVPKDGSHLDIRIGDGSKKTYDLTLFRSKFGELMKYDGLYMGYYLHLVQDLVYRSFVHKEHNWQSRIPGNIGRLHNDYALLNTYVISKYSLKNNITVPADFESESINEMYPYDTQRFLEDLSRQFIPYSEGSIFFFTEEMADDYIQRAADICTKELQAFYGGKQYIDEYEWAWNAVKK